VATEFRAIQIYKRNLDKYRRRQEAVLTAAVRGLVGKHVKISGEGQPTTGRVKEVVPVMFGERLLYFDIVFAGRRRRFLVPQNEGEVITIVEEP